MTSQEQLVQQYEVDALNPDLGTPNGFEVQQANYGDNRDRQGVKVFNPAGEDLNTGLIPTNNVRPASLGYAIPTSANLGDNKGVASKILEAADFLISRGKGTIETDGDEFADIANQATQLRRAA